MYGVNSNYLNGKSGEIIKQICCITMKVLVAVGSLGPRLKWWAPFEDR